jgi:hypothetical protein
LILVRPLVKDAAKVLCRPFLLPVALNPKAQSANPPPGHR